MCKFSDYYETKVRPICSRIIDDKFITLFTTPKLHGEERAYVLDTLSHLYDPYGMLAVAYMRQDIDDALKNGDIKCARRHAKDILDMLKKDTYFDKFYGNNKCKEYTDLIDLRNHLEKFVLINV